MNYYHYRSQNYSPTESLVLQELDDIREKQEELWAEEEKLELRIGDLKRKLAKMEAELKACSDRHDQVCAEDKSLQNLWDEIRDILPQDKTY